MLRPRRFVSRFDHEYDPGPVQVQARKVHFDVSGIRRNLMLICISRAAQGQRLTLDL